MMHKSLVQRKPIVELRSCTAITTAIADQVSVVTNFFFMLIKLCTLTNLFVKEKIYDRL